MDAILDLKQLSVARQWAANGRARRIREESRLTQAEVAEACGVEESTVSQWESGKRQPSGEPARVYARVLAALLSNLPGISDSDQAAEPQVLLPDRFDDAVDRRPRPWK